MMEGRNIATASKGQGGMTISVMTRKDSHYTYNCDKEAQE